LVDSTAAKFDKNLEKERNPLFRAN